MPRVGVSDLHYALMTSDSVSGVVYQAPVSLATIIEVGINPNVKSKTIFANNGPAATSSVLGEIEVEINLLDLDLLTRAAWLGKTRNGGEITDLSTDSPPYIALGWKSLRDDGSSEYVWLLKGKAELPEDKFKTQEDDVNYQTPTVKLKFLKRDYDNAWRRMGDSDDPDWVASKATSWFTAVTPAAPDAISCTPVPADAATGVVVSSNMTWTFNNAINASDVVAGKFMVIKASDGVQVAGALSIDADHKVVTFNPTSDLGAATGYIGIAANTVKDVYGQALAANAITNFTTA